MKFTKTQLQTLKQIWAEEKPITIKGVNNHGEAFETTGRITTDDNGAVGCQEKIVFVEFGKEKNSPKRKQTKWFAGYRTEYHDNENVYELYIFSIECEGKLIYENADKEMIKEKTKKNKQKCIASKAKDGLDRIVDCPVVRFVKSKIGQPITIRSLKKTADGWDWVASEGVVYGIEGCTYAGAPIVDLADGVGIFGAFIDESSVAVTVEDDKEKEVVVRNDVLDFIEKREKVQEYIREVADSRENENV